MRRFIIALALTLGVGTGLYFSNVEEVGALPTAEIETYFYSDATLTTEVGWRFRGCSGPVIMEGSFSSYKVIYPGDSCGSTGGGGSCYACSGPNPNNPPATMSVDCPSTYTAAHAGIPEC